MATLSKGLSLTFAANLAALTSSLVVVSVAARVLAKEELGIFFMAMVMALFAGSVADLGLRNGVIRVLSMRTDEYESSAMPYLVTLSGISSVVTCSSLFAASVVVRWVEPSSLYIAPLAWGGAVAFAMVNWQMAVSVMVGQGRYRDLSVLSFSVELLRIALSLGILLFHGGESGLLLGIVLSRLAGCIAFCAKSRSVIYWCLSTPRARELVVFSSWSYGSAVVSIVTGRVGDLLLSSYLGPAALATYSTAMQVPLLLNRGYESIRPVVLAHIASKGQEGASTLIVGARLMAGVLSVLALGVITTASDVVPWIFSDRYEESVPIAIILSLWVVVGLSNYFISTALLGRGQSQQVFWFSVAQLPVMIALSAMIVPAHGGNGAAFALLITSLVGHLLYLLMFSRSDSAVTVALFRVLISTQLPLCGAAYVIFSWEMPAVDRVAVGIAALLLMVVSRGIDVTEISTLARRLWQRRAS